MYACHPDLHFKPSTSSVTLGVGALFKCISKKWDNVRKCRCFRQTEHDAIYKICTAIARQCTCANWMIRGWQRLVFSSLIADCVQHASTSKSQKRSLVKWWIIMVIHRWVRCVPRYRERKGFIPLELPLPRWSHRYLLTNVHHDRSILLVIIRFSVERPTLVLLILLLFRVFASNFISATMYRQINQALFVCALFVVVNCFPDGGPADTCTSHIHYIHLIQLNYVTIFVVSKQN